MDFLSNTKNLIGNSRCPKCNCNSFESRKAKYAIEKWCANCKYFAVESYECCSNPSVEKVLYTMKDNRPSIREQCLNCGKRLKRKATSFKKVDINKLEPFDIALSDARDKELADINAYYDHLIKSNYWRRKQEYFNYLQSDRWKELRLRVLERDNFICQKQCGNKANDVHHLTYERLYNEKMEDLISLCRECHYTEHFKINK